MLVCPARDFIPIARLSIARAENRYRFSNRQNDQRQRTNCMRRQEVMKWKEKAGRTRGPALQALQAGADSDQAQQNVKKSVDAAR